MRGSSGGHDWVHACLRKISLLHPLNSVSVDICPPHCPPLFAPPLNPLSGRSLISHTTPTQCPAGKYSAGQGNPSCTDVSSPSASHYLPATIHTTGIV